MATGNENSLIQISSSSLDLDALLATFGGAPEFRDRLQSAAVVIVPTNRPLEHDGPLFPDTTRGVLQCLQEGLRDQAVVDAAVHDEDYNPFALYSADVFLPALYVAEKTLLPLVISLLGSFIQEHLRNRGGPKPEDKAKCEIHYEDASGKLLEINYDGPAATLERVIRQALGESGPPEDS